jgi:hypothetical protein
MKRPTLPDAPGRLVVGAAWFSLCIFTVAATGAAAGIPGFDVFVAAVSLLSLAMGFVIWIVAFVRAATRTTRGDDIVVASWVFLQGSAPRAVRRQILGAAALTSVVTVATMRGRPFVWLANLLPLGWAALWSAWHGTFPARRMNARPTIGRRTDG